MSSRSRTSKAPWHRGARWVRRTFWSKARQRERAALAARVEPPPARHRHGEKWDRS